MDNKNSARQTLLNELTSCVGEKVAKVMVQSYEDYTDMVRKGEATGKHSLKQKGYQQRKQVANQMIAFGASEATVQAFVNSLRPANNNSKLLATIAELEAKIAELTNQK